MVNESLNRAPEIFTSSELAYSHVPGVPFRMPTQGRLLVAAFTAGLGTHFLSSHGFVWAEAGAPFGQLQLCFQDESSATGWNWLKPWDTDQDRTSLTRAVSMVTTKDSAVLLAVADKLHDDGVVTRSLLIRRLQPNTHGQSTPMPAGTESLILDADAPVNSQGTFAAMLRTGETRALDLGAVAYRIGHAELFVLVWSTLEKRKVLHVPYDQLTDFPAHLPPSGDPELDFQWTVTPLGSQIVALTGVRSDLNNRAILHIWTIHYSDDNEEPEFYSHNYAVIEDDFRHHDGIFVNLAADNSTLEIIVSTAERSTLFPYNPRTRAFEAPFDLFEGTIQHARRDRGAVDASSYLVSARPSSATNDQPFDIFRIDASSALDPEERNPPIPLAFPHAKASITGDAVFTLNVADGSATAGYHFRDGEQWTSHEILEAFDPNAANLPPIPLAPYYEMTCKVHSDELPVPEAEITIRTMGSGELLLHTACGSEWLSSTKPITLKCDSLGTLRFRYRAWAIDSVQLQFDVEVADGTGANIQISSTVRPDAPYVRYLAGLETQDPQPLNRYALPPVTGDGTAFGNIRDPLTGQPAFRPDDQLGAIESGVKEMAHVAIDPSYRTRFVLECGPHRPFSFRQLSSAADFSACINDGGARIFSTYIDALLAAFRSTDTSLQISRVVLDASKEAVAVGFDLISPAGAITRISTTMDRLYLPSLGQGVLKSVQNLPDTIDYAYRWLSAVFDWDQIRRTQQALVKCIRDQVDMQAQLAVAVRPLFSQLVQRYLGDVNTIDPINDKIGDLVGTAVGRNGAVLHPQRSEYAMARTHLEGITGGDEPDLGDMERDLKPIHARHQQKIQSETAGLFTAYSTATSSPSGLTATTGRALLTPLMGPVERLKDVLSDSGDGLFSFHAHSLQMFHEELFKDYRKSVPSALGIFWRAIFGDMPMSAADISALLPAFAINVAWKVKYGRDAEPFPEGAAATSVSAWRVAHGVVRITSAFFSAPAAAADASGLVVPYPLCLTEAAASMLDHGLGGAAEPWPAKPLEWAALGLSSILTFLNCTCRLMRRRTPEKYPDVICTLLAISTAVVLAIIFFEAVREHSNADWLVFVAEMMILIPDALSIVALSPPEGWFDIIIATTVVCAFVSGGLTIGAGSSTPVSDDRTASSSIDGLTWRGHATTLSRLRAPAFEILRAVNHQYSDGSFKKNHYEVAGPAGATITIYDHARAYPHVLGQVPVNGRLSADSLYGTYPHSDALLSLQTGLLEEKHALQYTTIRDQNPPPPPPPPKPHRRQRSRPAKSSTPLADRLRKLKLGRQL